MGICYGLQTSQASHIQAIITTPSHDLSIPVYLSTDTSRFENQSCGIQHL